MKINKLLVALTVVVLAGCGTTRIDTSQIFVPEEGGIKFTQVTDLADDSPIIPNITYDGQRLRWWANPYFAVSSDGQKFAYISTHNGRRNIFVKPFSSRTGAQQRTFSGNVQDPCFSPNGDTICFTQYDYPYYNIFLTSASQGSIMQQVTSGSVFDYAPSFSPDGSLVFFHRAQNNHYFIWSYNRHTGTFSTYCYGLTPTPINDHEFLCSRQNSYNNYEIWRVNYVSGSETLILSNKDRSFTTASMSPDGKWILFAANTMKKPGVPENIDIYVVRADGSQLTQLTYHHGHDLSPVWAPDGKSIYFLSQRGTTAGLYNIWQMDFNL